VRTLKLVAALAAVLVVAGCGGASGTAEHVGPAHIAVDGHADSANGPGAVLAEAGLQTTTASLVRNARPQPNWRPYTGSVPILVYHDLGTPPPSEAYPGLYMSYSNFAAEMAWLHQRGYQAVTLDEVMDAWYHGATLPARPIVITFDNGYPPQVTYAPEVMSRYGWPGVLNEITENHLHNAQIESVLKLGWEVDSHSEVHSDLTTDTPAELHEEVFGSREFLRRTFRIPVNSFCYPSSEYNATVVAAVKAAGYTNAVTEGNAYATPADPYLLPRFEMETALPQLQADLARHILGP
jgi:peptidoglycan/xylan/chitin deacetylase (PgdA/CDA1 family)